MLPSVWNAAKSVLSSYYLRSPGTCECLSDNFRLNLSKLTGSEYTGLGNIGFCINLIILASILCLLAWSDAIFFYY